MTTAAKDFFLPPFFIFAVYGVSLCR